MSLLFVFVVVTAISATQLSDLPPQLNGLFSNGIRQFYSSLNAEERKIVETVEAKNDKIDHITAYRSQNADLGDRAEKHIRSEADRILRLDLAARNFYLSILQMPNRMKEFSQSDQESVGKAIANEKLHQFEKLDIESQESLQKEFPEVVSTLKKKRGKNKRAQMGKMRSLIGLALIPFCYGVFLETPKDFSGLIPSDLTPLNGELSSAQEKLLRQSVPLLGEGEGKMLAYLRAHDQQLAKKAALPLKKVEKKLGSLNIEGLSFVALLLDYLRTTEEPSFRLDGTPNVPKEIHGISLVSQWSQVSNSTKLEIQRIFPTVYTTLQVAVLSLPHSPMSNRLQAIRSLFRRVEVIGVEKIDVYLLPRTDYHDSEYIAERDERVKFISGFSGSNGYALITDKEALLWTDGRYFDQATAELYEGWTLMKQSEPEVPSPNEWMQRNLDTNAKVGFDPHLFSIDSGLELLKSLKTFSGVSVPITQNLVDTLWTDRPEAEVKPLVVLSDAECGESINEKLKRIRSEYLKKKCDSLLVTALDEIAWLYNVRGSDIPYNPVFFSVAFITNDDAHLFIDEAKLNAGIRRHLSDVVIHPYEEVSVFLKEYHLKMKNANSNGHKVLISDSVNFAWASVIPEANSVIATSPVKMFKAIKNDVELEGSRNSHIRDSAAIFRFIVWLEGQVVENKRKVSEKEASEKMLEFRKTTEGFVSESFATIAGIDEHAALPHYHMSEESGKKTLEPGKVFLLDSGGQYRDGTTDVTRTVVFGNASDHVKEMFTRVLKAHIQLALTPFPTGTFAVRLDGIARTALWEGGYDYGHGVGHGVGFFLNVHEFPPTIGFRNLKPDGGLKKGMTVTIEPGYYDTGNFGIRIENVYELVQANVVSKADNFIRFESLTWVPIQRSLIVKGMLSAEQLKWINDYHSECLEKTGSYFKKLGLQRELDLLTKACAPL